MGGIYIGNTRFCMAYIIRKEAPVDKKYFLFAIRGSYVMNFKTTTKVLKFKNHRIMGFDSNLASKDQSTLLL